MVVVRHISPNVVARYPYGVTFLRPEHLDSVLDYAATDIVPIVFRRDKTDLRLPNEPLDSIVRVVNRILDDKGLPQQTEGDRYLDRQAGQQQAQARNHGHRQRQNLGISD